MLGGFFGTFEILAQALIIALEVFELAELPTGNGLSVAGYPRGWWFDGWLDRFNRGWLFLVATCHALIGGFGGLVSTTFNKILGFCVFGRDLCDGFRLNVGNGFAGGFYTCFNHVGFPVFMKTGNDIIVLCRLFVFLAGTIKLSGLFEFFGITDGQPCLKKDIRGVERTRILLR